MQHALKKLSKYERKKQTRMHSKKKKSAVNKHTHTRSNTQNNIYTIKKVNVG